jgi:penicillin-binding protein 2
MVDYRSSFEVRPQILHRVPLPKQALDTLRLGLWKVVNEDGGTGSNARVEGLDVSGKTGTAQVITQSGWYSTAGLPFTERDHAWFASYAPGENPQMVVVALIEHAAAHGGTGAAPLAKLLYQARFPTRSADVSSARVRTGRPHSSAGPSLAARAW